MCTRAFKNGRPRVRALIPCEQNLFFAARRVSRSVLDRCIIGAALVNVSALNCGAHSRAALKKTHKYGIFLYISPIACLVMSTLSSTLLFPLQHVWRNKDTETSQEAQRHGFASRLRIRGFSDKTRCEGERPLVTAAHCTVGHRGHALFAVRSPRC